MQTRRRLGKSGIEVSAIGLGCWAIGGMCWQDGKPIGWAGVDDDQSVLALRSALDLGVNFFDTADVYGCGHSERILGRAFAGLRDRIVIATKFGMVFDEATRTVAGRDYTPKYIRRACESSLRRLQSDFIDLYQFHLAKFDGDAGSVLQILEDLRAEGKIRAFGWSTNDPKLAIQWAESPNCAAIQMKLAVIGWDAPILDLCDRFDMASINKGPLMKGILTGKFEADVTFPADDVRSGWADKRQAIANRIEATKQIRHLLTADGRTPAQGSLAYLLTRSSRTIPIPGFKSVDQVRENIRTLDLPQLDPAVMREIEDRVGAIPVDTSI
jgi:aryl-alcohol dehydrogenase-like predicted oxidoreductase